MKITTVKFIGTQVLSICSKILGITLSSVPFLGEMFGSASKAAFNKIISSSKYSHDLKKLKDSLDSLAMDEDIETKLNAIFNELSSSNASIEYTEKQRKKLEKTFPKRTSEALFNYAKHKMITGQNIGDYLNGNSATFAALDDAEKQAVISAIDSVLQVYLANQLEQMEESDQKQAVIITDAIGRQIDNLETTLTTDITQIIANQNLLFKQLRSHNEEKNEDAEEDEQSLPEFEDLNLDDCDLFDLIERAQKGNDDAQFQLALCFFNGVKTQKDFHKAFEFFSKAADRGNAKALCNLGVCYQLGRGVEENPTKAFECYLSSANLGNAKAQFNLASCYETEYGVKSDMHQACIWHEKAAFQGLAAAQANLGLHLLAGIGIDENAVKAVEWLELAAAQNNPLGMTLLARCYFNGNGIEKDIKKAFKLYYKAATELNDSIAQLNLALFYSMGIVGEPNNAESFKWMSIAAQQGESTAQAYLGNFYMNGIGVEKDNDLAFKWLTLSVNNDDPLGYAFMSIYYANNLGAEQDLSIAYRYAEKSAEAGNAYGQFALGTMFIKGLSCEQDVRRGIKLLVCAAKQQLQEAVLFLQQLFDLNIEPSLKKEIEIVLQDVLSENSDVKERYEHSSVRVKQLAEEGNPMMQAEYGMLLLRGVGVEKNEREAVRWLEKAVESDHIPAYAALSECYVMGWGVEKDINKALQLAQYAFLNGDKNGGQLLSQIIRKIDFNIIDSPSVKDTELFNLLLNLAQNGFADAQSFLALKLYKGKGIEQDKEKAVYWFTKAAMQGNNDAQYFLALCYENGDGVKPDIRKATIWYARAAEKGDACAEFALGRLFANGRAISVHWYLSAAKKGFGPAQMRLGQRYENGDGVSKDKNKALEWYQKALENRVPEAEECIMRLKADAD